MIGNRRPWWRSARPAWTRQHVLLHGRRGLVDDIRAQLAPCCRSLGVVEDLGDHRLPWERVDRLVLADPEDVAGCLAQLESRAARRRRGPLPVLLVEEAASPQPLPPTSMLQIQHYRLAEQGARAVLRRWPPHLGVDARYGQLPHILVFGDAPPAQTFWGQLLRLCTLGEAKARLTLVDDRPERIEHRFLESFPQASQIVELGVQALDAMALSELPPVTMVLVCDRSASRGLARARALVDVIARQQAVMTLALLEVGSALPQGESTDWDGRIVPFAYRREALRPERLLGGDADTLARVIHEHYCDTTAAQGRDPSELPAGQPWGALDESYRDASRHQADHLWAKLALTDCRAVPEDLVDTFAFTLTEVERLARVEHQRWAVDRYLDGWSYAPVRDNARKEHPQLVPFADLSEPMKDLDRFAVRLLPTLLARDGQGILRMLILGIKDQELAGLERVRLHKQLRLVFKRLRSRYPFRALVVASALDNPNACEAVRTAVDDWGAGFFCLLAGPAQPSSAVAASLMARAERRIVLDGPPAVADWLESRAEILLNGAAMPGTRLRKQVNLKPDGALQWSFEY